MLGEEEPDSGTYYNSTTMDRVAKDLVDRHELGRRHKDASHSCLVCMLYYYPQIHTHNHKHIIRSVLDSLTCKGITHEDKQMSTRILEVCARVFLAQPSTHDTKFLSSLYN
jgi:hypothetical protein